MLAKVGLGMSGSINGTKLPSCKVEISAALTVGDRALDPPTSSTLQRKKDISDTPPMAGGERA